MYYKDLSGREPKGCGETVPTHFRHKSLADISAKKADPDKIFGGRGDRERSDRQRGGAPMESDRAELCEARKSLKRAYARARGDPAPYGAGERWF